MIGPLDTHELVEDLKASGFTDEQAEAVTRAVRLVQDLDASNLATRTDIADVRLEIEKIRFEIAALEARLIKWVIGAGIAAFVAVTGALTGVIWTAAQILLRARA
jgi:hypothetical protein